MAISSLGKMVYAAASRYTTNAFMRIKLGEDLARRRVAPHIFESAAEAHEFVRAARRCIAAVGRA